MKTIQLTRGYVSSIDDEKYEEISDHKWNAIVLKNRKGEVSLVYAIRTIYSKDGNHKYIYMHREIMGITDPKVKVDHEDHDGLNNVISNLRVCGHGQNLGNSRLRTDNTSGYKGVQWYKPYRKWRSRIQFEGKNIHIGYHDDIEDAAAAYERKAKELFGEFYCTEHITTKRST